MDKYPFLIIGNADITEVRSFFKAGLSGFIHEERLIYAYSEEEAKQTMANLIKEGAVKNKITISEPIVESKTLGFEGELI